MAQAVVAWLGNRLGLGQQWSRIPFSQPLDRSRIALFLASATLVVAATGCSPHSEGGEGAPKPAELEAPQGSSPAAKPPQGESKQGQQGEHNGDHNAAPKDNEGGEGGEGGEG